MSIYDALQRAESRRLERVRRSLEVGMPASTQNLVDDVQALASMVKRLGQRLDDSSADLRQELSEVIASIEVAVDAMEDRLETELGPAEAAGTHERLREIDDRVAHLETQSVAIAETAHAADTTLARLDAAHGQLDTAMRTLEERVGQEIPQLRDELDELIEKRTQSSLSQLVGREEATRARLEARIDALRADLDRSLGRQSLLLGAAVLVGLIAYAC